MTGIDRRLSFTLPAGRQVLLLFRRLSSFLREPGKRKVKIKNHFTSEITLF